MALPPYVSIHAPAWGATPEIYQTGSSHHVSIHAPAWGATRRPALSHRSGRFQSTPPHGVRQLISAEYTPVNEFQSTPPHGVRLDDALAGVISNIVSIHAPAWGATMRARMSFFSSICFNPRPRMGCDCSEAAMWATGSSFQSTPPHGVRPAHVPDIF